MAQYSSIFSEYDIPKFGIKFDGDTKATVLDTMGSFEIESEVKTVTKQKRNMPWKTRVKETGSGTNKISVHIPYDMYARCFGAFVDGYKENVQVYGTMTIHKEFCLTTLVEDEDSVQKLQAFPCCMMSSGISRSCEANGDEVSEVEMEITFNPDTSGIGLYEMVLDPEGTDNDTTITSWLENFSTSMVKETA